MHRTTTFGPARLLALAATLAIATARGDEPPSLEPPPEAASPSDLPAPVESDPPAPRSRDNPFRDESTAGDEEPLPAPAPLPPQLDARDAAPPEAEPEDSDEPLERSVLLPGSFPVAEACCPPLDCCPSWRNYFLFDFLFLQRDNGTNDAPLVFANSQGPLAGDTLLATRSPQFATAPGIRTFLGRYGPDNLGWEVGYLGLYGMYGDAEAGGVNLLEIPGDLGQAVPGWSRADYTRATYASTFNMFQANVFRYDCCREQDRCSRYPWERVASCHCIDWMAGFVWAGLEEDAALDVICCEGDPPTSYRNTTSSQMMGGLVGVRGRREWERWAVEGWVKTAVCGTHLSGSTGPITSTLAPGVEFRPARTNSTTGMGFIGDINMTAIYKFNRTWGLRMGYNLIWLSGVALAGNQFDFTDTLDSGRTLYGRGSVFFQGGSLGLEARW